MKIQTKVVCGDTLIDEQDKLRWTSWSGEREVKGGSWRDHSRHGHHSEGGMTMLRVGR